MKLVVPAHAGVLPDPVPVMVVLPGRPAHAGVFRGYLFHDRAAVGRPRTRGGIPWIYEHGVGAWQRFRVSVAILLPPTPEN